MRLLSVLLAACTTASPADSATPATPASPSSPRSSDDTQSSAPDGAAYLLQGVYVPGREGQVDIRVEAGRIVGIGAGLPLDGAQAHAGGGRWVSPGFIDSHVHLAYLPEADAMARAGVVAAVDLAAPIEWLAAPPTELRILASGPMITAMEGYPTTSWGRDGYGLEVADTDSAVAAVDHLVAQGAGVIKVPLAGGPELDNATLAAVAERAHSHGLKLAVHALDDASALRGAQSGADLLVHIPTTPLSDATVAAWSDKAVVPTLAAFGDSTTARDNLRRLHEAGTTVLYGTDFGNAREVGISVPELAGMSAAGMSAEAIYDSATRGPADYWGWSDLGRVEQGALGELVLLDANPMVDASTWARERRCWP